MTTGVVDAMTNFQTHSQFFPKPHRTRLHEAHFERRWIRQPTPNHRGAAAYWLKCFYKYPENNEMMAVRKVHNSIGTLTQYAVGR